MKLYLPLRSSFGIAGRLTAVTIFSQQILSAYTDPGSGTLMWQLLVGGIVGISFELRRIKNWFTRKFKK
jgi:hypothetical protein